MKTLASILLLGLFTLPLQAQELDLTLLDDWLAFSDADNALYHYLNEEAQKKLEDRTAAIRRLNSVGDWKERQQHIRETLHRLVGPFPERTPLNARITGRLERDRFTVEKILFESQPGYYVTAALFLPANLEGKAPGILFCSGHTTNGFRSEVYQTMVLNLVHKGFVVLAFDPVGQGERQLYLNEDGKSTVGGPTRQHSYPGAQQFILGQSPARSMIWDGIRAIDYLVSRPEVDPDRIGATGRSGGGTQTAYIAAFDERVAAAAPEAYITSFSRLLDSIGPQDAEQNLFHGVAAGIDHADLLAVRAPKPTLMITTTRDFFSIQGARETYDEVRRVFDAYGAGHAFDMVEDDAGHASTSKNREAMYRFFQQAFGMDGSSRDEEIFVFTEEKLQVTPAGQVALLPDSRSLFDLVKEDAEAVLARLDAARQNPAHLQTIREKAMLRSGYLPAESTQVPVFAGQYAREGYRIERYWLPGEGGYPLPFLVFVPDGPGPHPAIVYLHPEGKPIDESGVLRMASWAQEGHVVMAPDLPGAGELGMGFEGDAFIDGVSMNVWFASILTGRSLTGIQAGDLNRLVQALHLREDVDPVRITGLAYRTMASPLLHAAVADTLFQQLVLVEPLISTAALVTQKYYTASHIPNAVAGSLIDYDTPDLAARLAPLGITLLRPTDPMGEPVSDREVEEAWQVALDRYEEMGAAKRLRILTGDEVVDVEAVLAEEVQR